MFDLKPVRPTQGESSEDETKEGGTDLYASLLLDISAEVHRLLTGGESKKAVFWISGFQLKKESTDTSYKLAMPGAMHVSSPHGHTWDAPNFETFFEDAEQEEDEVFLPEMMRGRPLRSMMNNSFDGVDFAGRGRSTVVQRRSRSPTPLDDRPLQPFDHQSVCQPRRRRTSISSEEDSCGHGRTGRSSSPSRSIMCPPSNCGELETTRNSLFRTCGIITIALVVLTTAASVPKLSRVEIDVDYSHMLGKQIQDQLLLSAAAHGKNHHHPRAASPSVARAFDEPAALRDEDDGSSSQPMRLRGGESPSFTPSASTCDLKAVLRGGSVSHACQDLGLKTNAPSGARGAHYRPKLSRTIDIH